MSAITQVPFYPSDWLAGTRGMTAAQMGVYITLIAMMYERAGPVRCDDLAKLARLCGTSASALNGLLDDLISDGKIMREGDLLSNRRAMLEIENVLAKSEVARDKANARWQKKPEKSMIDECSGMLPAMQAISHKPIDTSSLRSDVVPAQKSKPEKSHRRKATTPAPDGFWPDETGIRLATESGMTEADVRREVAAMLDRAIRDSALYADWQAAWRTWCRNFQRFKPFPRTGPAPNAPRRGSGGMFDAIQEIRKEMENGRRTEDFGQFGSAVLRISNG